MTQCSWLTFFPFWSALGEVKHKILYKKLRRIFENSSKTKINSIFVAPKAHSIVPSWDHFYFVLPIDCAHKVLSNECSMSIFCILEKMENFIPPIPSRLILLFHFIFVCNLFSCIRTVYSVTAMKKVKVLTNYPRNDGTKLISTGCAQIIQPPKPHPPSMDGTTQDGWGWYHLTFRPWCSVCL
jgi:hypothetical protein